MRILDTDAPPICRSFGAGSPGPLCAKRTSGVSCLLTDRNRFPNGFPDVAPASLEIRRHMKSSRAFRRPHRKQRRQMDIFAWYRARCPGAALDSMKPVCCCPFRAKANRIATRPPDAFIYVTIAHMRYIYVARKITHGRRARHAKGKANLGHARDRYALERCCDLPSHCRILPSGPTTCRTR
jgi:hypothetical protein